MRISTCVVVLASGVVTIIGALPSAAQNQEIQEVIVTGSRIARPNLESTVPITSVSGEEIFQSGNTAVGDMLNDLPSLRSTISQSNSSRFLGTTGLNLLDLRGLDTQRTLVLVNGRRHVGADILRNAVSPDINTFPSDLIERIDVVTGGNSAVYGSDAIAGVVNFVLKRDFEGMQVRAQGGNSSEGDAGDYYASFLAGTNFAEDRGNIAANVEYAKQEPLFASDRSNTRNQRSFITNDSDPAGAPNGSDGVPDRLFYTDVRSATLANGGSLLLAPASGLAPCGRDSTGRAYNCSFLFQPDGSLVPQTGARIGLAPNGNYDGGNGTNNREGKALGIFPKLERASFNVLGHLTISDAFEPFVEAKYVRTDSMRYGQPAFFQGLTIDGTDPTITAPALRNREQPRFDNPFLTDAARAQISAAYASMGLAAPTAATNLALRRNLLDLGGRREDATRETSRIVLGVTGQFADDWSYEVAVNYGKFKEDTDVLGNLNQQRFLLAMDSTRNAAGNIVCRSQIDPAAVRGFDTGSDAGNALAASLLANDVATCVPLNPFGNGSITPAMRNYLTQDTTSVAEIEQFVTSAVVSGNSSRWFELPAGPIGIAVGLEHRTEENFFKSDALVESGITFYNALPLFDPPKFEVDEAFGELRIPLLNGLTMARELTFNAAGRYADYKGATGEVFAHNLGLEWAPIDSLRFRVGKARAVRAPNLVDLYSALGQNFAGNFTDPCSARNIGAGSATRAANCAAAGIPTTYDYAYTASIEIKSGGNPNLTEETSDSVTAGFVFRPTFLPNFSLSVDYFEIDIDDVITAPEAQDILNSCYDSATLNNQFCGLFQRAGAGGGPRGEIPGRVLEGSLQQVVLNYATSTARGIDLEAAFRQDLGGMGLLNTRLVYTRTLQRDDFLDLSNPSDADQLLLELGDPRDSFNLSADIQRGPVTLGYELRYIGKMVLNQYEDTYGLQGQAPQNADYAARRYYPSVVYHDLRASYDFSDSLNAYIGVDNVADKLPPLDLGTPTGLTAEGGGIYEQRGRFFFAGAKYSFGGSAR